MGDRENRQYKTADLPTLIAGLDHWKHRELLYKIYEQTCTTWRALVDVRFKLFAIVPTVSLLLLANIFGASGKDLSPRMKLFLSLLGLIVTIGLLVYELRNSQLHDDLISRGRKIEEELGIDTGVFRGRTIARSLIKHDVATFLI
jgi:hypothetical protein